MSAKKSTKLTTKKAPETDKHQVEFLIQRTQFLHYLTVV